LPRLDRRPAPIEAELEEVGMARIPEQLIDQIKAEVSIVRLAELAGVELRPQGEQLIGRCPFHPDDSSSLRISPKENAWRCGGDCEAGGSAIEWTMRAEGVSFPHAVELLRDGIVPSTPRSQRAVRSTVAKLPPLLPAGAGERELLARVVDFYAEALHESPQALAYLKRRGLGDPELLKRFRLGYANRTLGYRLPAKNRKAGAELRGKLKALGVLRDSGHEHLSGSLVVPICDEEGAVTQLYGRKLHAALRAGTPRHLYLPGPRGIFNVAALGAGREAIVCESPIDALTFWACGLRNVIATPGPEGEGEELCAALAEAGTRRVLIAFDADAEGERGAEVLAVRLGEAGIECLRVRFPAGEDANSFACAAAEPPAALAELLREATRIGAAKAPAPSLLAPIEEEEPEPAPPRSEESAATAAQEAPSAPAPPPPTTPPPGANPVVELAGDELRVQIEERRWRVRGIGSATSFESLRVNVMVARQRPRGGEVFHLDTLDLYSARSRGSFARAAGKELGLSEELVARDLGRVLLACEERAEQAVREAQAPAEPAVELNEAERERALELLRDPALIERICTDFERIGVVGERDNCLLGYLAAVSRKLDRPLAIIVQSTSAAGKSALQEAVLAMVPSEERVSFSAMTGQSLFYMGETDLRHKVLAIAEEEGAKRAAYALKLLHSEGELRIASTGKEGSSGRLITHTYTVRGPVAIFLTTTTIEIDEELLNRCIVLGVDEERSQTRAIHQRQRERETLEGLLAEHERAGVLKLHRDAQRLLEPVAVVNPYARALGFADARTRTRRDHTKYLALIRSIALLHQHQRPKKAATTASGEVPYIEVTRQDIALANRLAHAVLGHSLEELPPGTRRLLGLIDAHVDARAAEEKAGRSAVRFTRRELREALGWGDTQLKVHLARLVELELIWAHRGPHGGHLYELAWEGGSEEPRLSGLIDPARLDALDAEKHGYDRDRSGSGSDRSGGGRPPVGGRSGAGRPPLEGGG
jgi:DNA primase